MKNWKDKISLRFIWSYVAILFAALVAIFLVVNAYTGYVLRSKLVDFSQSRANEALNRIDGMLEESKSVALQITLDVKMYPHLALKDKTGETDIIRKLNTMKTASTNIEDIILHYADSNEIFCTDAKRSVRYLNDPTQYSFLFQEAEHRGLSLTSFDASELSFATGTRDSYAVAVTYGLPFGSSSPYATVSCVLPYQVLSEAFSEVRRSARYAVYLAAPGGEVFFQNEDGIEEAQAALLLENAQNGKAIGSRYQMVTAKSEKSGLQVWLFLDESDLFSSTRTLSWILFLMALVVLLFAVGVNIYISRRNIAPLLDLREFMVLNDIGEDSEDPMGVFDGVRQIYSDNQILAEQLTLRRRNILNNVLVDILTGSNPQALGRRFRTLNDMGICLAAAQYAVVCISIEDETVIADKAVLMLEDRIAQTEYAGRIFPVCREEKNRMMVLLLFRDMDDNDLTANIAFLELAFDSWQIPVRIAAGSVEPRMEDIPVSASKAQALLDEGSEVVSRYPGGENEGYRFWYTEGQVVRQLMEGNAPDKAIDYFYSILTRMERMSRSHASCLPMAMTIAVTIVENCLQPPQRELVADELDRLTHAETLADLGACMKELIYAVCSTAYSRKQQETAALLQEIVAFVNKNFMWEQMSLELLSRQFNVSIHFISKSFQTVAGANFSQYLTGLRMNYAKELLRTTEKTLREITADIGYVDESSFSRKFKAMFGVTPGQYRKQAMRERGKE